VGLASVVSYPNPSTDGTANLSYEVSGSSSSPAQDLLGGSSNGRGGYDSEASVTLRIFTRSGRLLWTHRVQGVKQGTNSFHWDGHDVKNAPLANGLYLYTATLEKNGVTQTKTRAIFVMK
jgi:flagellar hook assembly protein FlgD